MPDADAPRVPAYGRGTLGDLLPSVAAHLGLGGQDALGLPDARRYVVLLADGLGWDALNEHASSFPLWGRAAWSRPVEVGAPTTTVTSLTSLGTGLAPGQHGVVGYTFRLAGRLLQPLSKKPGMDALDVQPGLTWFERFEKAGIRASAVEPVFFSRSLLTNAALRGARFLGVADEQDPAELADAAALAAASGEPSVTYVYVRALDHEGHAAGLGSARWNEALRFVGEAATKLRAALPDDVVMLVTGDHGMVDVPRSSRVVISETPALREGVTLVGGEARFRHLYVRVGQAEAVAARWADALGDAAWVRTRAAAVADGWFGPLSSRVADRIGDVLVAARGDVGVFTDRTSGEWALWGMHGSLTPQEIQVPLIAL